MTEQGVTMVTKRNKEELDQLEKEHGHIMMADNDFSLLLSPMGVLWVDKQHPEYYKIVEQCILYNRMFGNHEKVSEYEKLLPEKEKDEDIKLRWGGTQ